MEGKFYVKPHKTFPYKIEDVSDDLNKELLEDYTGEGEGFVQVGSKRWFLSRQYRPHAETIYNFKARPDDVWIVTYPRTGCTMTQEILWLLSNNLDFEKAAATNLLTRFPLLEYSINIQAYKFKEELLAKISKSPEKFSNLEDRTRPVWAQLDQAPGKRLIKTHLPFDLLSPNLLEVGCKVVYLARNPKDVAVSYYHLYRLFRFLGYSKDFAKFWDYFERGLQLYGPFWSHLREGWERRNEKNFLFLFYEDVIRDMPAALRKISKFLGKNFTDEEFLKLAEHMKFDNFKKNSSVNFDYMLQLGLAREGEESFVRKGVTGGWKEYFPPDLNRRADDWIEKNLKNTDLRFPKS